MAWRRMAYPAIGILFFVALCTSCESNSSSDDDTASGIPSYEDVPLYGTWAGYFKTGEEDKVTIDGPNETYEDIYGSDLFEKDPNYLFIIAIIDRGTTSATNVQRSEARFISDRSMFVCSQAENYLGIVDNYGVSKTLAGYSSYYSWASTTGADYSASIQNDVIWGRTIFTNSIIGGLYWVNAETPTEFWKFQLFNYSTSGLAHDLSKVAGTWEIRKSFKNKNTLRLIISPNGLISGEDSGGVMGNDFEGTIQILYSDSPVYRVNLRMNGTIDLAGLATYIESMDSGGVNGVSVEKTLAIGVTGSGRLITGFASPAGN